MAAYGPGRKFKKVPPKGKKPIRPPIKVPFMPNEYSKSFIDMNAYEAFLDDLNIATWPKKVAMNAVKQVEASLEARYSARRDLEIDINTPEKELEDLPGASGAGVSVNLKDWLDDPAKALDKTTSDWWDSVINLEDFTRNAELKYVWKPLMRRDTLSSKSNPLSLVKRDDVTGEYEGVRSLPFEFKDPTGALVTNTPTKWGTNDPYAKISTDLMRWADVSGSRSARIGAFETLQFDFLATIERQLDDLEKKGTNWRALAIAKGPAGQRFVDSIDDFRSKNLEIVEIRREKALDTSAFNTSSPQPEKIVYGNKRDRLSIREKLNGERFRQAVAKTRGPQVAGLLGAQLAGAVSPQVAAVAAAAAGVLHPELNAINKEQWSILNERAQMQQSTNNAWKATQGLDLSALPINSVDRDLLTTWMGIVNFRETQSTANDFLEALDSKSFFKMFVWSGRLIASDKLLGVRIPGLSAYAKYLTPSVFIGEALDKVNYFGLTGAFGDPHADILQPFAHLSKFVADNKIISNIVSKVSLGLFEAENYAYIRFRGWDPGTRVRTYTNSQKILASELNFMTGIVGIDDSDWKLLSVVNSRFSGLDPAAKKKLFDSATTLVEKQDILEKAITTLRSKNGEVLGEFGSLTVFDPKLGIHIDMTSAEMKQAMEHFANMTNDPRMRAVLLKFGVMDATENIDEVRLNLFLRQVGSADLGNKYLGFVQSAGRKLDYYQTKLFNLAYGLPIVGPGLEKFIRQFRGGWLDFAKAASKPKAWARLMRMNIKALGKSLSAFGSRLPLSVAIKAFLKRILDWGVKALIGASEFLANILPVVGPLLAAAVSWIVTKILKKIWGVIKGPTKKGVGFIYKVTFGWWLTPGYGILGTGEDIKIVGCVGCGGCLMLPLLAIFAVMAIAGANMNFTEDFTAASPDITISKTIASPVSGTIALGGTTTVSYRLTITNTSADAASGVTLVDKYNSADGVSLVSCEGGPTTGAGTVTWGLGTLTAHETKIFNCQMNVAATTDKFVTNSAELRATIKSEVITNVATATLKVGNPVIKAPCDYPAGSHSLSASCTWSGHPRPAVDINYSAGTSLKALIAGTATRCVITTHEKQMSDSYGIYVDVVGAGFRTRYGHLQAEAGEFDGQGCRLLGQVAVGDIIGKVGLTGKATGTHVHYEIFKTGSLVCPESYLSFTAAECH